MTPLSEVAAAVPSGGAFRSGIIASLFLMRTHLSPPLGTAAATSELYYENIS